MRNPRGDESLDDGYVGYHLHRPVNYFLNDEHVFLMVHQPYGATSTSSSPLCAWCRSNKYKLIALFLVSLILLQYTFGASVYNIRLFDRNIAQIYVWNGGGGKLENTASSSDDNGFNLTSLSPDVSWTSPMTDVHESGAILSSNMTLTDIIAEDGTSPVQTALEPILQQCPLLPALVGPIKVWFDYPSFDELQQLYPDLGPGGHGKPKDCVSRHRVAIVIPYRDREKHLRGFLHNMHSLLSKQQLDYAIYIVEQIPNQTFNRAKLMNVGFAEAMKLYDWQCVIFHDVDLLPEDDRNIYSCPEQPRHMSVAIDKFSYRLPYADLFGGISALTAEQFRTLNGFSNDYWGWGGEDDDMASRVLMHGYKITRYPAHIARYKMIKHVQEKENPVNPCRYNLMYKVKQRWRTDGLNSTNYKVLSVDLKPLYTRILVDLLETESRQRLDSEKVCAKKSS